MPLNRRSTLRAALWGVGLCCVFASAALAQDSPASQPATEPASQPASRPAPVVGVLALANLAGDAAEAQIGLWVAHALCRAPEMRCPELSQRLAPSIGDADPVVGRSDAQLAALGQKAECRFVVLTTAAAKDGRTAVTCRLIDRDAPATPGAAAGEVAAERIELPPAEGGAIELGEAAARAVLAKLPVSDAARAAFAGRRKATANAVAWADYCLALRAWGVGDLPAALAAVVKATKTDRDFAAGYCLMGRVLLDRKRPVLAEAAFRKAGELDPTLAEAHHWLAEVLRQEGRLDDALAVVELAVKAEPDEPRHRALLGTIQQARGQHAEALAAYDAAAELGPADVAAQISRGVCLAKLGRTNDAIAALKKAIDLEPKSIAARNTLADIQRQANDVDAALETLDVSIQIDPAQNGAYFQTADIYLQLQRWSRVIDVLKKITDESDRRDAVFVAQAWKMIGKAHAGAGEKEAALAAYARSLALRRDPTVQTLIDKLNAPPAPSPPPRR